MKHETEENSRYKARLLFSPRSHGKEGCFSTPLFDESRSTRQKRVSGCLQQNEKNQIQARVLYPAGIIQDREKDLRL